MALIGNRGRKPMSGAMMTPEQMQGMTPNYGSAPYGVGQMAPPQANGQDARPQFGGGPAGNPPGVLSMFQPPSVDGSPMVFDGVEPATPPKRGGFLSKNGGWRDVVGGLGDAMQTFGGGKATYAPLMAERRMAQQRQEEQALQRETSWQDYVRRKKYDRDNAPPEYFTVGRDRVKFDPATDQSQVVYDGPEDFDEYASALGIEPGTDEYESAVLDYVLRGHGPTALGYDKQLDDYRTANDKGYDDYRTRNRLKVRGTPSYRDKNPLPLRTATRKPAAPPVIAVNPKTGEKLMVDSRGNWVPVK